MYQMYRRQKNSYGILGVKGSTDINTKLITYYKCILTEFEDICASREFQLIVSLMSK